MNALRAHIARLGKPSERLAFAVMVCSIAIAVVTVLCFLSEGVWTIGDIWSQLIFTNHGTWYWWHWYYPGAQISLFLAAVGWVAAYHQHAIAKAFSPLVQLGRWISGST